MSHITENLFVRQRISAEFGKCCIDRKGQIQLGIDERAVQIEDQRAYFRETGDVVPLMIESPVGRMLANFPFGRLLALLCPGQFCSCKGRQAEARPT